jgi:uncharacterized protein YukE
MATNIDELVVQIRADTKQLTQALDKIKKKSKDAGSSGKTGFAGFTAQLKKMKGAAMAAVAAVVAIGAAVVPIAKVGMAFEDLQISLNTVFGGIRGGKDAFDQVINFAKTTPFQIEDVTKAFIRLKSAGLEPDIEMLKTFGDAASIAGNATEAFAALVKIASKATGGGLGLEELEQLETQGIAVYPILRKELNLTRDKIADFGKTTEGAALIIEALQAGLKSTTGGTMSARMENLSTKVSNLTISFKELALGIFEGGLGDLLKSTTDRLTAFINEVSRGIRVRNNIKEGKATASDRSFQISQMTRTYTPDMGGQIFTNKALEETTNLALNLIPEMDESQLRSLLTEVNGYINDSKEIIKEGGEKNASFSAFMEGEANRPYMEAQQQIADALHDRLDLIDKVAESEKGLADKQAKIDSITEKGAGINAIAGLDKLIEKVAESENAFLALDKMSAEIDLAAGIMKAGEDLEGNVIEVRRYTEEQVTAMRQYVQAQRDAIQETIDADQLAVLEAQFADVVSAVQDVISPTIEMKANLDRMRAAFTSDIPWARAAVFGSMTDEEIQAAIDAYIEKIKEIDNPAKDVAKTLGDTLSQAVTSISLQFTNNFVNALMDGKNALSTFKDFAKNIVSQIISIFLQMAVVNKILNAVFSGVNGGKGLGLDTIDIGGGSGGGIGAGVNASGGHYSKGQPMLVGERGPELIIPNTSGSVMNGMNTKNAMGGGDTIIVNQSLNFSTGVVGTVRAEINKMMPTIAEVSKSAVLDASRRGGNYRKGLLGSA